MTSKYINVINSSNQYNNYIQKKQYWNAYKYLEKYLVKDPDDIFLLTEIAFLCTNHLNDLPRASLFLKKLIKIDKNWFHYFNLSRVEAELEDVASAKEHIMIAEKIFDEENVPLKNKKRNSVDPKKLIDEAKRFIQAVEYTTITAPKLQLQINKAKQTPPHTVNKEKAKIISKKQNEPQKQNSQTTVVQSSIDIPSYSIPVNCSPVNKDNLLNMFQIQSTLKDCQLFIEYAYLNLQKEFDDLLCLKTMKGVEKYWYQIETVKKVLKNFHGRVLLSDEVGLGKTIEAGMILKEYLLRGMVKNILILTPAPLVSQWKEEMLEKFDINFVTTDDALFHDNHFLFWKNKFIIASIHTAKSAKNSANVINEFFDLVVVDEAHHLKNQNTLAWKLVNEIKKRFIFLLTATPVQNNLIELFNLITLLKPGQFKTKKSFKAEYVQKGDESKPIHKDALRELLKDVMIRNTRSAIDVKLPKRFATTLKLDPTEIEREIYMNISEFIKETGENIPSRTVQLLMQEAGSSPFALKKTLINSQFAHLSGGVGAIIKKIDKIDVICKEKALLELILKNPDEKKVIFTQYLKSMDYIMHILNKNNLKFVTFRGDMTTHEKDQSINSFKENVPILLSSESGGEGRNLQFCNTIINFDLPWNPMKIEQRIGRLHRIGQTRDVFIFNLSIKNTIEDYIINILDNKINMFEMVIGEIEPILGYLGEDKEFENIIFEIWLRNSTQDKIEKGFNEFGENMIKAKTEYLNSKEIDKEIFGEDYEV